MVRANYALLTPDTFVRAPLPGMAKATAIVHAAPALGAAFTQYTAEFESSGVLGPAAGERFLYVLEGELTIETSGRSVTGSRTALHSSLLDRRTALRPQAQRARR